MDITRLRNDKKLELCRSYFKVGFFLLPFVWAVNAVWFYKEAFCKPAYEEQRQIKKYVLLCGGGAIIWAIALISWVTIFQLYRVQWGATGDANILAPIVGYKYPVSTVLALTVIENIVRKPKILDT